MATDQELQRYRVAIARAVHERDEEKERVARKAYAHVNAETVVERAQRRAQEILDAVDDA